MGKFMWNEVYLEKDLLLAPRALSILEKLKRDPIVIERFDDLWGRSKKPYLHKRDSLNLFIAQKKGKLLKEAPAAYGLSGEAHYYFIHAYNCIYECEYCYLQGYFNSPDIVLFINHEEIILEMEEALKKHAGERVWFHAGEFSDSLALTHLTGELEIYHDFCRRNPLAFMELRTKAVNTRELLKLKPLPNMIVSFSLSPEKISKSIDQKTPGTNSRLRAMKTLKDHGFRLGAHFDPIVYEDEFRGTYGELCQSLKELGLWEELEYLSLGVVRFTKEVYREVENNYPDSLIHSNPLVKSFDGKVRYHRPLRMWMMNSIKDLAIRSGCEEKIIYLCMEENETGL
jgi:spore photoproduct lyase